MLKRNQEGTIYCIWMLKGDRNKRDLIKKKIRISSIKVFIRIRIFLGNLEKRKLNHNQRKILLTNQL